MEKVYNHLFNIYIYTILEYIFIYEYTTYLIYVQFLHIFSYKNVLLILLNIINIDHLLKI
jgi:hypothetical protein